MATLNELLTGKNLEEAKEMYAFARKNNFYISWYDQSKDKTPRIFITIHPEGKPQSIFERNDSASWYFYLNDEDKKDNFGSHSRPEKIRGEGGKEFKNFKRFMSAIVERYNRYNKQDKISNIINQVLKESNLN